MTNVGKGYSECYMCATAGTALSDTATAGILSTAKGALYLGPEWLEVNQGAHLHARGIISTPATATATLKVGVSADTTQGTIPGSPLLWVPASVITPVSSASNWFWELEMELIVQSVSGLNAAIEGMGELTLPASASQMQAPYAVGSTTPVNVPIGQGTYFEVYAVWTTAVASDTITCETVCWITT
jgi:hypothetical protein